MGKITRVKPTLDLKRADVAFVIKVDAEQEEEIAVGDTYFLRIEGSRDNDAVEIPTVRVTHASYMAIGLKRRWTLHVEYA